MIRAILGFILVIFLIDTASARFLPKAFEATFLQEKYDAIRKRNRKNNIKIKYQFSGKFYLKELSADSNTLYVCNPQSVWVYNPPFLPGEKGLLRKGSSSKYCFSKIFDSLSKGLKDNNLYTVTKTKSKSVILKFKKKAKAQLGLDRLEMYFTSTKYQFKKVKKLKLFYSGEKYPLTLTVKSLKVVKGFPKKVFNFVPPKNTEIKFMK